MISIASPALTGDKLRSALARLRDALDARDVAGALHHLQALVPDYTPSRALLSLAGERAAQVPA